MRAVQICEQEGGEFSHLGSVRTAAREKRGSRRATDSLVAVCPIKDERFGGERVGVRCVRLLESPRVVNNPQIYRRCATSVRDVETDSSAET